MSNELDPLKDAILFYFAFFLFIWVKVIIPLLPIEYKIKIYNWLYKRLGGCDCCANGARVTLTPV